MLMMDNSLHEIPIVHIIYNLHYDHYYYYDFNKHLLFCRLQVLTTVLTVFHGYRACLVKVGLQGHRAQNEDDLMDRISAFHLASAHRNNYFQHVSNNCLGYLRGQR